MASRTILHSEAGGGCDGGYRLRGFIGESGGVLFSMLANETAEPVDKVAKAINRPEVDTCLDVRLAMTGLGAIGRDWMMTLLVGTFVLAAVGLGWYGRKASLRIAAWGEKLNECDLIFQQMCEPEEGGRVWGGGKRMAGKALGTPHFLWGRWLLK